MTTHERSRTRYPRWEPEYRLKLLRELKDYELVLLFSTPPARKGRGSLADGHYAIADLHSHEVELEQLAAAAA